jgi:2,4-dienoyl-CoA reductase-like NADH-dependent reductase (Old Yellow Enzyme family)
VSGRSQVLLVLERSCEQNLQHNGGVTFEAFEGITRTSASCPLTSNARYQSDRELPDSQGAGPKTVYRRPTSQQTSHSNETHKETAMPTSAATKMTLLGPTEIGPVKLRNRLAVAPMTRVSAAESGEATPAMASYYERFAEGEFGLIITEGLYTDTQFSQGYYYQPGMAVPDHAGSWKEVIRKAHRRGTRVFAQIMHAGSQSQGNRYVDTTVGPSAIAPKGAQLSMYRGHGPYPTPQAITPEQLRQAIQGFVDAALLAKEAGFDGVEIHGANGYLIDQFLTDYLNTRTDEYGGPVQARVRVAAEVCKAVKAAVGSDMAVGIRISQGKVSDYNHRWHGGPSDAKTIFTALGKTGIDFVHTTEYRATAPAFEGHPETLAEFAARYSGVTIIANGNLDIPEEGAGLIRSGHAHVVALGKPALANRDWPRRLRKGHELASDIHPNLLAPIADIKDWEL